MAYTVLVVDDANIILEQIKKHLKACVQDLKLLTANDGIEGLLKFNTNTVDLVITDWNMPNVGGHVLIQNIRKKRHQRTHHRNHQPRQSKYYPRCFRGWGQ